MGRDSWRFRQVDAEREKRKRPNPMLRGIGCILIIVLSLAGYAFAELFLRANTQTHWIPIPAGLVRLSFATWMPDGLAIKLVLAFLFMIVSYGIMSFAYAIVFPIRLGETDSPPLRQRPRRRP